MTYRQLTAVCAVGGAFAFTVAAVAVSAGWIGLAPSALGILAGAIAAIATAATLARQ